ncbi:MAG: histidine--tRNA ligase [bacterium]|nr:histidine--tRNA ligase [bacterium]
MTKKKVVKKFIKPKKLALPKPKVVVIPVPPAPPVPEKPKEPLQAPRGMRDILPADEYLWRTVKEKAEKFSRAFGYGEIVTPILEHKGLFVRGVGSGTDVVQKEMYSFKDQGGDELCLRPEGTAAVARAYINHGMYNLPQPVKLWSLGPLFRRERPQAGRYRQFHQWSLEVLGDPHPVLDAEVISIAYSFFKELKLPVTIEMNSIGCEQCRGGYKEELVKFYGSKRELLCESCKTRFESNRLRLLDCKEPQCELLKEGAPSLPDSLCEACRDHFMKVLEYLDEIEVPYNLNSHIVRGLDYYNRTVFEVFPVKQEVQDAVAPEPILLPDGMEKPLDVPQEEAKEMGAQSALGGGGRYDGLVEQLGGRPTPAVGFSIGLERVIAFLRTCSGGKEPLEDTPRIFIAQLGDVARRKALSLWHTLSSEVPVVAALSKDGLKAQLEIANRLQVRYAIIIGQKEIIDKTAIIRDMEAGMQEVVDYNKLVNEIKKKLAGGV